MCMTANRGGPADMPPVMPRANIYQPPRTRQRLPPARLQPARPPPPTRPPYERNQRDSRLRQRRPVVELPPITWSSSSDEDSEEEFKEAMKRALRQSALCTCKEFHEARARRRAAEQEWPAITNEQMMSTARLFAFVAIAILTAKIVADTVFSTGVSGMEIGGDHRERVKCNVKRQLSPIEQGDVVIDNIFQIPINTLNAVGTLIKNVRPLVRRTRERIQQFYNTAPRQQKKIQQNNDHRNPEYHPFGRHSRQIQEKMGKYQRILYQTTPTKRSVDISGIIIQ